LRAHGCIQFGASPNVPADATLEWNTLYFLIAECADEAVSQLSQLQGQRVHFWFLQPSARKHSNRLQRMWQIRLPLANIRRLKPNSRKSLSCFVGGKKQISERISKQFLTNRQLPKKAAANAVEPNVSKGSDHIKTPLKKSNGASHYLAVTRSI
jgi:hypothetical protein